MGLIPTRPEDQEEIRGTGFYSEVEEFEATYTKESSDSERDVVLIEIGDINILKATDGYVYAEPSFTLTYKHQRTRSGKENTGNFLGKLGVALRNLGFTDSDNALGKRFAWQKTYIKFLSNRPGEEGREVTLRHFVPTKLITKTAKVASNVDEIRRSLLEGKTLDEFVKAVETHPELSKVLGLAKKSKIFALEEEESGRFVEKEVDGQTRYYKK